MAANKNKDTNEKGLENTHQVYSYEDEQNKAELSYFDRCEKYIKTSYIPKVRKEIKKEWSGTRECYDREGFRYVEKYELPKSSLDYRVRIETDPVVNSPYFAHISHEKNADLYIGKKGIPGWVMDWADKEAERYYYNYDTEIGNEEDELFFVRDIYIKKSKYTGYKDRYNKYSDMVPEDIDERLREVLTQNQDKKSVHDIITSIARKQYSIISSNKDDSIIVQGCAGSGKTMIMMHKIRYMQYNYPELNMRNVIVISPTSLLQKENEELAEILQLRQIQQFSVSSFYEDCCKQFLTVKGIDYEDFEVIDDNQGADHLFDEAQLKKISAGLRSKNKAQKEKKSVIEQIDQLEQLLGEKEDQFHKIYVNYSESVSEINDTGRDEVIKLISGLNELIRNYEEDEFMGNIVNFLKDAGVFSNTGVKNDKTDEEVSQMFPSTRKVLKLFPEKMRGQSGDDNSNNTTIISFLFLLYTADQNKEDISQMFEEWKNIPGEDVAKYLKYLERRIHERNHLVKKKEILEQLLEIGVFNNKQKKEQHLSPKNSFEKLVTLYTKTESKLKDTGYTPFSYFTQYDNLQKKKERMENNSIFDGLMKALNIDTLKALTIQIPKYKAVAMIQLLCYMFGPLDITQKYLYIDEYQDLSLTELQAINKLYPNATTNLFGDIYQCINDNGITHIEDVESIFDAKLYEINRNYRNARQITDYVNDALNKNIEAIGLEGKQETVEGNIPDITIEKDDRIAIIVTSFNKISKKDARTFQLNFVNNTEGEIIREAYNVIPVELAKGLEFEKVIVIRDGMNDNQFYVACTRAINELYVVT